MLELLEPLKLFLMKQYKKTVLLDDLQAICVGSADYKSFSQAIHVLEKEGVLLAVKSAGIDFSGLPRKFRIAAGALYRATAERVHQEILQMGFSSRLNFSWYYAHPFACWQEDHKAICQLSLYMEQTSPSPEAVSLQQRSYEIFGDEKFLLGKGRRIFERLGLSAKDIHVTGETDPLMLAVNPVRLQQSVCHHLVVENKAPYYRLLPFLLETDFGSLILGYGWKIAGNLQLLPEQTGAYKAHHVVWYFGDFDAEGIRIWHALQKISNVEIHLAQSFYEQFLHHEASVGKEYQQTDLLSQEAFWKEFSLPVAEALQKILRKKKYYPQETLSAEELRDCWRNINR